MDEGLYGVTKKYVDSSNYFTLLCLHKTVMSWAKRAVDKRKEWEG